MSKIRITIDNNINISYPPPPLSKEVKRILSFPNPAYDDAISFGRTTRGIPKKIRLYEELNGILSVPRGTWGDISEILNAQGYQIEVTDNTVSFDRTALPKEISLWEYQKPWVAGMMSTAQGVGIAPPGAGKTLMALKIYEQLGQPCLWVTHTQRLATQVARRAEQFLGIEAGLIGKGKEDIKHFTVGLVPTLVRRDLSKYKDKFGLILIDECHHVPASTFLKVVSEFAAMYRFGVTATPYREDQLEKLIFKTVGPSLAYLDKDDLRALGKLMTPEVVRKHTRYYFPYNPSSRKHNYHALVDDISADFNRNQQIATDVIVESTLDEDNVCIVLVGRIQHGENLLEMIEPVLPNTGFVHSKMTPKERDRVLDDFESGKFRVLIATYKMLAEGFDYQPSNRLFLTAPFKGRSLIEQACGRIERAFPGKDSAIVYDYVDARVGVLVRQSETRLDIYETNNNPVTTLSS
jgi:superfamily II DNA or RNA helicase